MNVKRTITTLAITGTLVLGSGGVAHANAATGVLHEGHMVVRTSKATPSFKTGTGAVCVSLNGTPGKFLRFDVEQKRRVKQSGAVRTKWTRLNKAQDLPDVGNGYQHRCVRGLDAGATYRVRVYKSDSAKAKFRILVTNYSSE